MDLIQLFFYKCSFVSRLLVPVIRPIFSEMEYTYEYLACDCKRRFMISHENISIYLRIILRTFPLANPHIPIDNNRPVAVIFFVSVELQYGQFTETDFDCDVQISISTIYYIISNYFQQQYFCYFDPSPSKNALYQPLKLI